MIQKHNYFYSLTQSLTRYGIFFYGSWIKKILFTRILIIRQQSSCNLRRKVILENRARRKGCTWNADKISSSTRIQNWSCGALKYLAALLMRQHPQSGVDRISRARKFFPVQVAVVCKVWKLYTDDQSLWTNEWWRLSRYIFDSCN